MALDSYHHGVRVVEVSEGTRTIRTITNIRLVPVPALEPQPWAWGTACARPA